MGACFGLPMVPKILSWNVIGVNEKEKKITQVHNKDAGSLN